MERKSTWYHIHHTSYGHCDVSTAIVHTAILVLVLVLVVFIFAEIWAWRTTRWSASCGNDGFESPHLSLAPHLSLPYVAAGEENGASLYMQL